MSDSNLKTLAGNLSTGARSVGRLAAHGDAQGLRIAQGMSIGAGDTGGERPSAEQALETARKFEALLVHNMLKAMRSTTFAEDGGQDQSLYYDMLDEKLATIVTEKGGMGLAENLARQIHPQAARADAVPGLDQSELRHLRSLLVPDASAVGELPLRSDAPSASVSGTDAAGSDTAAEALDRLRLSKSLWNAIDDSAEQPLQDVQQQFVDDLMPMARQAAARLGTTPASVLAVAAHESDWGRQVIGNDAGDSTHNLFGIKAFDEQRPGMWHRTTEYVDGAPRQMQERFRSYVDRSASVSDFASFLQQNPRYSMALQHAGSPERFIKELHSAGYATDPHYASKVMGVMRRIEALAPATQGSSAS